MVDKVKLSCQIVGYVVDTAHSVATRSNSFGLRKKNILGSLWFWCAEKGM